MRPYHAAPVNGEFRPAGELPIKPFRSFKAVPPAGFRRLTSNPDLIVFDAAGELWRGTWEQLPYRYEWTPIN